MEVLREWSTIDGMSTYRVLRIDEERVRLQQVGEDGQELGAITVDAEAGALLGEILARLLHDLFGGR